MFGPHKIIDFFNYGSLDLTEIFNYLKDNEIKEIKNLNTIDSGVSTIVFEKNKDKVICVTIDYAKVLYMKKSGLIPGFKFLKFGKFVTAEDEDFYYILYEMDYLTEIYDEDVYDALSLFESFNTDELEMREDVIDILYDIEADIDFDIIDKISLLKHLPTISIDLHDGQFLKDKENRIICFDPILSDNIYI